MTTAPITIQVEPKLAEAYLASDEPERRKLDLLLSFRLQDAMDSHGSLRDLISDISRKAQARGLTPEILEDILNER